jgi:hypothetical protein
MGLKLEMVRAKKGDCLLLHYGEQDAPALSLVDGGAPGAYDSFLAPRLAELRAERGTGDAPLPLELVMISHIDQDHLAGVLNLLRAIEIAGTDGLPTPYAVGRLWHNAFRLLTAADDVPLEAPDALPEAGAIVASVPEGAMANTLAVQLGIPVNDDEAGDLLLAGDSHTLPGGLALTVLGPTPERIEALREEWAKKVKADPAGLVPASVQETVTNLSSLIAVAEHGGRRILLTGDGVAEDILAGLARQQLLDAGGRAHFDVLKVPHHGSVGNISEPADFLQRVTADHYAISGNGEHGNPELATLRAIATARGDVTYDIWLTYREGEEGLTENLATFEEELSNANGNATIHFPEDGASSMTIDLA